MKDNADLHFYPYGLNTPDKIEIGVSKTIAIGYPLGLGKNVRLGNVSQTDSDYGKEYITYKNDICPSDSGGALFIVEDGNIKLTALTTAGIVAESGQMVNIGYGLKVSSVVKDMENQLKSGKLSPETAKEVKNFLKLNKK